jgi:hypothetical protein
LRTSTPGLLEPRLNSKLERSLIIKKRAFVPAF